MTASRQTQSSLCGCGWLTDSDQTHKEDSVVVWVTIRLFGLGRRAKETVMVRGDVERERES